MQVKYTKMNTIQSVVVKYNVIQQYVNEVQEIVEIKSIQRKQFA